jgi:DNA-directed RNA polymerase subunit H (RpoH/RPB5)
MSKHDTVEEKRAALIRKYRKLKIDKEEREGDTITLYQLIPPTLPVFDIFDHKLVPKAELASGEEKEKLVEAYHAQPYQFPWIQVTDPVSIILGAEPGDIIKITAESETAGISESYRYVV